MAIPSHEVVSARLLPGLRRLRARPWIASVTRFIRWPKDRAAVPLCAIALAGLVVGLVFGVWPGLDLAVSGQFYDDVHRNWPLTRDPVLLAIRDVNAFATRAIIGAAAIALLFAAAGGRSCAFVAPRAAVFLLLALAAGPGLIANVLFKSHWGRPRPVETNAFGGQLDFVPWWSPFGACESNCSFVSGEAASAFALLAVAILLPPRYRAAGVVAAIVYGLAVSLMRVAMGGHFLSDTLFAGVFTALAIWLLHRAMFRRRPPAKGT
jgi:lipid A 4'-phosphatase